MQVRLIEGKRDQKKALVMADIAIIIASTKGSFLNVAKQAAALGVGLQNAAPGKANVQNNRCRELFSY